MKQYLLNNAIAFDQLVNTLLGGSPDETMSARAFRSEQQGKLLGKFFRPIIDLLFWFDVNHCNKAYLAEKYRQQFPTHYSKG